MSEKNKDYCFTKDAVTFIFVFVLLTSCVQEVLKPKYGDGGLLSDAPCSAPCFLSIIPGKTNKSQAIDTIKNQGIIEYQETGNIISFSTLVFFEVNSDGYISKVEFDPMVNIKIGDVINKYGEPSKVSVRYDILSMPEHPYFDMVIYFDKIFSYLVLPRQEIFPAYEISQDTLIKYVIYFDEDTYKDAINTDKHITEWKGFGSYKDPQP
jgi:hypothetical protein